MADDRAISTYLDFLRVAAAAGVVLYHLRTIDIGSDTMLRLMPPYGHEFVVVFFVLSGYVIAASADRKRSSTLFDYSIDRLSRIYSVALPALILSTLTAIGLGFWDDNAPGAGSGDQILAGFLWNLPMMGQAWQQDIFPPSNPPFWSLCYEFMYYGLFGCAVYVGGWRRWFSLLAVGLLAGPKVLLLMPCWLVGVAVYHCRDRYPMNRWTALIVGLALPATVFILMAKFQLGRSLVDSVSPAIQGLGVDLGRSERFPKDYVTALLIGLNIYGIRWLNLKFPPSVAGMIKATAALTFSLYLLHYPILLVVKAAFGASSKSLLAMLVGLLAVAVITYGLGSVTELRRAVWRSKLVLTLQRFGLVLGRLRPG